MSPHRIALVSSAGIALALGVALALRDSAPESSASRAGQLGARRPAVHRPAAPASVPRREVVTRAEGTYIQAMIDGETPRLRRWTERTADPVRVWIAPGDSLDGWRPSFPELVREAFAEWWTVGVPLRFDFVDDSARAEVRVRWTTRLPEERDGLIVYDSDGDGWVRRAEISLAVRTKDDAPQSEHAVRAIALHEVGHLLGLEHSPEPADIMAPVVEADTLSDRDRATALLLYTLPPGRVD